MSQEEMIVARGLTKSYRSTRVLEQVDFTVRAGEIYALLGPNGAGKTTAINILTTLIKPDSGTATIAGVDLITHPDRVRAALSLTGQDAAVDEFQTGQENLAMMAKLAHLGGRGRKLRVSELLARFDLGAASTRRVATYSGGMRRRLDLAISLVSAPPVVFLDEPTTGLDPRSRNQLWDVVRDLANDGTTILLTTQYLEEADQLADTIAVLDGGVLVAEGSPAQLKSRISGDHVELTFDDATSYARAAGLAFGAHARLDGERQSLAVPTTNSVETIRELLALASEHNLLVSNISIIKPTLDDVFLSLTGRAARSNEPTTQQEVAA
jgi:ABC-2 type transport system ATP-binding protein